MIPVYKPYLPPGSLKQAHDALDSTWLSSQGKYIQMATEKLQELLQIKYVLPLNNGTSACHLVAKTLQQICPTFHGKKKLIVPNNVYVAAWNAFLFDGDYELFVIDADLDTWNFDLNQLDEAIFLCPEADVLVVHNIGNIINVPELQKKYPNTHFVEDNCEGFLGTYNGIWTGTASFASAISFFGNKNITSGEGGAFITNNEEAYELAKQIHGQGQSKKRFVHDVLGYNYRMTNIQAAILCGQLDQLNNIERLKYNVFSQYRRAFANREDIRIQSVAPGTEHANWMFGVRIIGNTDYEDAERYFKEQSIEIRPMFYSILTHRHLRHSSEVFGVDYRTLDSTNADLLQKESFILPSFPELSAAEQTHIIATVEGYLKMIKG
jgi:perosamine synthetase